MWKKTYSAKMNFFFHRARNWTHFIVPQANSLKKPIFVFLRQPCLFTESFSMARMATTHFIHVTVDQNGVQLFKLLMSNNTYFGKREVWLSHVTHDQLSAVGLSVNIHIMIFLLFKVTGSLTSQNTFTSNLLEKNIMQKTRRKTRAKVVNTTFVS